MVDGMAGDDPCTAIRDPVRPLVLAMRSPESHVHLAIRLAIYCAEDGQSRPDTPDLRTAVTSDNVTSPHQTNVCRATTDQKVGGSNPSERAK